MKVWAEQLRRRLSLNSVRQVQELNVLSPELNVLSPELFLDLYQPVKDLFCSQTDQCSVCTTESLVYFKGFVLIYPEIL